MGQELAALRQRLKAFEGARPAVQIDPALVRPSMGSNRHESAHASPAFDRLKDNIDLADGNGQPILVRRVDDGYEIVSGHRRQRACSELGLRVFAVVCDEPLSDLDLFLAMERENREREDLSPYDQGRIYVHASDSGLLALQRKLAVAIGVSHSWIRKAVQIARLPVEVIEAFLEVVDVQQVVSAAGLLQPDGGALAVVENVGCFVDDVVGECVLAAEVGRADMAGGFFTEPDAVRRLSGQPLAADAHPVQVRQQPGGA